MNDNILLKIQNSDDIDEIKRIAAALLGLLAAQQEFRQKQAEDLLKMSIRSSNQLNQALDDIT